jgi:hypothetical protein
VPEYAYPATIGPGNVPLPPSDTGTLLVISLVDASLGAASAGTRVARSYDAHPWELSGEMRTPGIVLTPRGNGAFARITLPPPAGSAAGRTYVLSRFSRASADGTARHQPAEQRAARLLMQATFGPTRSTVAEVAALANDTDAAAREWVRRQMALPVTSLREHYRRRVSPRLPPAHRSAFIYNQPACTAGSLWQSYTFTEDDIERTLRVDELSGGGYRALIEGEVRP